MHAPYLPQARNLFGSIAELPRPSVSSLWAVHEVPMRASFRQRKDGMDASVALYYKASVKHRTHDAVTRLPAGGDYPHAQANPTEFVFVHPYTTSCCLRDLQSMCPLPTRERLDE